MTALPILRAVLISGVAAKMPTPDIRDATARAASAAAARAAARAAALADAIVLAAGGNLAQESLWIGQQNPFQDLWADLKRVLPTGGSDETARGAKPEDWSFWIKWYEDALAGREPIWAMLEEIALIPSGTWEQGPRVVNPLINDIWARHNNSAPTAISEAAYFDFIEVDRKLRAVAFPSDVKAFPSEDASRAFLEDLRDLRDEVKDWVDYVSDQQFGQNFPNPLKRSVEKLLDQFDKIETGESVSLRRLVTIGSDLRRLSMSRRYREGVGDELAEMLDDRIKRYSDIAHEHLGGVFAALEPLAVLELEGYDSGDLIAIVKEALTRMDQISNAEMPDLTEDSRAVLQDLLRELEEWHAEIADETSENRLALLQKRFAERFGGYSATYGRYVERGREVAGTNTKRFDEAVKWYKRWDTLQKIVEWWEKLGGPPLT